MINVRIVILATVLFAVSALFLLWGLSGKVVFILELRAVKLASLILVGGSIGVATIIFQTVSANRILTPSIMGFDALFLLLQTTLIFTLGGLSYVSLPTTVTFIATVILMVLAALILFQSLLGRGNQDLHLLILVGVIFGLLFRSLTSFMQRIIDPSEFAMIQSNMFASFGSVDRTTLLISAILFFLCFLMLLKFVTTLDIIALGRSSAISLGVSYEHFQRLFLIIVAVLVSVSTVLVGPITFLGLLVSALTYSYASNFRHTQLLPIAFLLGGIILVTGQTFFERALQLQSTLAVGIEFFGGLLFLFLVAKRRIR